MCLEGRLKQPGRVLRVDMCTPPHSPAVRTMSGQICQLLAAMTAMSGVYLSFFCCAIFWKVVMVVGEFDVMESNFGSGLCGKGIMEAFNEKIC